MPLSVTVGGSTCHRYNDSICCIRSFLGDTETNSPFMYSNSSRSQTHRLSPTHTPYTCKCGVMTFLDAVEIHFDDVVDVKILDMIPFGLHTVAAASNTNFLWAA
jgi:hypothetical protein